MQVSVTCKKFSCRMHIFHAPACNYLNRHKIAVMALGGGVSMDRAKDFINQKVGKRGDVVEAVNATTCLS
jgi:hypothetical protein